MKNELSGLIQSCQSTIGTGKVVAGISGGIDSLVLAVLLKQAVGNNLVCLFIDTGLHRIGQVEQVRVIGDRFGLQVRIVDASKHVFDSLIGHGISQSCDKKKAIKKVFNNVFFDSLRSIGECDFFAHGTIKDDLEALVDGNQNLSATSWQRCGMDVIEPLKSLTKAEVRLVGANLGISNDLLTIHPLSAWGLARKIIGEVTERRLKVVKQVDSILIRELKNRSLYERLSNACVTLMPIESFTNATVDAQRFIVVLRLLDQNTIPIVTLDQLVQIANMIRQEVVEIIRVVFEVSSTDAAFKEWD